MLRDRVQVVVAVLLVLHPAVIRPTGPEVAATRWWEMASTPPEATRAASGPAAIFTGHLNITRTVLDRLAGSPSPGTDRLLGGLAQRCTNG